MAKEESQGQPELPPSAPATRQIAIELSEDLTIALESKFEGQSIEHILRSLSHHAVKKPRKNNKGIASDTAQQPQTSPDPKSKRKPLTNDEFFEKFIAGACRDISELKEIGDMAIVVVLTSLIENALMRLIDSRLVDLKCGECDECNNGKRCDKNYDIFTPTTGTLGSLGDCSSMAFRMGLVNAKFRKNLSLVGKIRNRFAHHPGVIDFTDHEIAQWCGNLHPALRPIPQEMFSEDHPFMVNDPVHGACLDSAKPLSGKLRFQSIVSAMITEMNGIAHAPNKPTPPARCGHAF